MNRIKFKVGQVLNFSWNGKFGRVIKFHNKVKFRDYELNPSPTHTAIVSKVTKDKVEIFEALTPVTKFTTFPKEELEAYIEQGHLQVLNSKVKLTNVRANCKKYEGVPYGKWTTFAAIGINIFSKFLATKIADNADNLICSELVARICYDSSNKKINIEKEFNITYHLITPAHYNVSKFFKVLN